MNFLPHFSLKLIFIPNHLHLRSLYPQLKLQAHFQLFQPLYLCQPSFFPLIDAALLLHSIGKGEELLKQASYQIIIKQIIQMHFKEDSIEDFINYKLNNPQALHQEMKMIKDRQDCTKKLNEYARHMQNLKNQYNMYKELYEANLAKKSYLLQTYEQNKADINDKIAKCKDQIELNNNQIKQRQSNNELNRKKYSDFQKEIALKKDKLTEYHLTQLSSLFHQSQQLKRQIQEKKLAKIRLLEDVRVLRDRQKITENASQNLEILRNKWTLKRKELEKIKEEEVKKQKEIREQINNAISMEKVIYGNFYKRCAQTTSQMREGLRKLFQTDFNHIEGSNLEEKLQKMLQQLKANKQQLLVFIDEKRSKYKIGSLLPEADAHVYNNIVETKINAELLTSIHKEEYKNNDYLLKEIEDGLSSMFETIQAEKKESLQRQAQRQLEIEELKQKITQFQDQIETKRKQILSPTKRSKKN